MQLELRDLHCCVESSLMIFNEKKCLKIYKNSKLELKNAKKSSAKMGIEPVAKVTFDVITNFTTVAWIRTIWLLPYFISLNDFCKIFYSFVTKNDQNSKIHSSFSLKTFNFTMIHQPSIEI